MITKRDRRTLLTGSLPIGLALLLVLPFITDRIAQALGGVALALTFTIAGMALAAPIQENGYDA